MTRMNWRALVCAMVLAALGSGAARAVDQKKQAIFDAAQAALDKGDWAAAASGFAALVPIQSTAPLDHTHALIAERLASALNHEGRFSEALLVAQRAAAGLGADDPSVGDALVSAGDAARYSFDYPAAIRFYEQALGKVRGPADGDLKTEVTIDLAFVQMTIDPAAVGTRLDALLTDKTALARLSKGDLASVEDLRARAALNAGDAKLARTWVQRAIDQTGGLTMQVSLSQVAMRNDAAIISSVLHDDDSSRKYLAYTGAGHLKDNRWPGQFDGELPVCSEIPDWQPNDSVVIQFSIGDDGQVLGALPVYSSRPGIAGAAFAQAVSTWHWAPDDLKKIDSFWRNSLVLQLRCSTRPSPKSLEEPIRQTIVDWLASKGVATTRAALSYDVAANDPRLKQSDAGAIPALFGRMTTRDADRVAVGRQLAAVLSANNAPPAAYALSAEFLATRESDVRRGYAEQVTSFQSRNAAGPESAWLLVEWALKLEDLRDFRGAQPLLQRILMMPETALPQDSPFRRVALLHAALVANRLGDAAATSALAHSDLDADQCSLYDTHPVAQSVGIASSAFPMAAMSWGFEGYVRESYDIGDDGHVGNIRTIVAYPPFIFAPTTEHAVRSFRYIPPRIGGKAVGCTSETQAVNYVLG